MIKRLLITAGLLGILSQTPALSTPPHSLDANLRDTQMSWIRKTINYSRKDSSIVMIAYKKEHELVYYENGDSVDCFPISLGWDSTRDKQKEGDGRTPEGNYRIIEVKDMGQTSFHRAFRINYPNSKDRKQGKTGSLIEIHGRRGPNAAGTYDWTSGCIAISDEDIDSIFNQIRNQDKSGKPVRVTIVKSR